MIENCIQCKQPLIEVDNRGKRLVGCLTCNEWLDDEGNLTKLSVEGLRCAACTAERITRNPDAGVGRRGFSNAPIGEPVQPGHVSVRRGAQPMKNRRSVR